MFGVELVKSKVSKQPLDIKMVEQVVSNCKKEGLMIRNLENIITFVPILTMSKKEIKKMISIFENVLVNTL